jgi:hypothetical protein
VRADLLPTAQAAQIRELLVKYAAQRILLYQDTDVARTQQVDSETTVLQNELWHIATPLALAAPTAVAALVVVGMNDVLNSQGYAQAAWRNRLAVGAWVLMIAIGGIFFVRLTARSSTRSQSDHPGKWQATPARKRRRPWPSSSD